MRTLLIFFTALLFTARSFAQATVDKATNDSADTKLMQNVLVNSYSQNRKLLDVPAAILYVGQTQLNRFGNSSILPAVNANPGVRMEERSPGSYRFNIRGSSLRSPFGVRDVKVYFNEIPLTDPGGNTYLNQLGFYNFQSIEIIKGPAGSMYGAGTGGAVLIRSMPVNFQPGVDINYIAGSFANNHIAITLRAGTTNNQDMVGYSHQTATGYRQQTNLRRDVASWEKLIRINERQSFHAYALYADLYYQTPGALTKAEFDADPQQARPSVGAAPGATQNKAGIYQKNFTVGLSNEYRFDGHWQNTSSVYGAYTDFSNPGIRVYEKRKEPHFGGRSVFEYDKSIHENKLQLNIGAEAQKGFFNTKDYSNKLGNIDTLQTDDDIDNWLYTLFAQGDLKMNNGWTFTVGASLNKSSINFTRLSKRPVTSQKQVFENKLAPRFAVLKKITDGISVYGSAARGFSTPTVSELLKSNGVIGNNLQPGDGIDYEIGIRGIAFSKRLQFDVNTFSFRLKNTIVQRIDTSGVFFYTNAGATKQRGLEVTLQYDVIKTTGHFLSDVKLWNSYTNHDFHYQDFKQLSNDFSGKQLPGVAPETFIGGIDMLSNTGLYGNITYTYTGAIALNDANTDVAGSYNLLAVRFGCKNIGGPKSNTRPDTIGMPTHTGKPRLALELFGGIDNLFNTRYSLGNDINAAAGRYYNAAPGVNYYAGIILRLRG